MIVIEAGPLSAEHVQRHLECKEAGINVGSGTTITHIRASHQRVAQLLALGVPDHKVALLCNLSPSYISGVLKRSPAFQELLASYQGIQQEEFADFVAAAADLSMDLLQHVSKQLEEAPERFTPSVANELIKTLADRSGHSPVTKSLNVNVNTNMGDRLKAARERAAAVALESLSSPEGP